MPVKRKGKRGRSRCGESSDHGADLTPVRREREGRRGGKEGGVGRKEGWEGRRGGKEILSLRKETILLTP